MAAVAEPGFVSEEQWRSQGLEVGWVGNWAYFENTYFTFFEAAFQKRKKRNPKFEVSDFADFSLHGISTTAQKQCMFIIYMTLVVA